MSEISKRASELIDVINNHMIIIENSESVLAEVEAEGAEVAILAEGDEISMTDLTAVLSEKQRKDIKEVIKCMIHENMQTSEEFLESLTGKKEEEPKKVTRKKVTKNG